MRLEEGVASEELDQYTSDTPYVTREAPAKVEDNLRGSVMSRRDDGRVVLVLKSSRAKVDKSDLGVKQDPSEPCSSSCGC